VNNEIYLNALIISIKTAFGTGLNNNAQAAGDLFVDYDALKLFVCLKFEKELKIFLKLHLINKC